MLDIEPIDRDVRMFHVALDRLSHATYDKTSWMQKHSGELLIFFVAVIMILGLWFIVGKIGTAVAPLAQAGENAVKIQEANDATLQKLDGLIRALGHTPAEVVPQGDGGSGLVPAV